jgi:hypothetical protein
MKKLPFLILPILFSITIFTIAPITLAQSILPVTLAQSILPAETGTGGGKTCTNPNGCGDYSLNDILQLGINISNWILGVTGSVVLLFFIIGGLMFILSGGNTQTVEKGRDMLIGSVVGLVIIFTSYIIIQFAMTALGIQGAWQVSGWFK